MKQRASGLQQSILQRLRMAAEDREQPFDQVLTYYGIERFLYRLSQIEEAKDFVLKGALLMMTWPDGMLRATRDIDMRSYLPPDETRIKQVFQKASRVDAANDGIYFDSESVSVEPIIERASYAGFRARLWGYLARTRIRIQIDLGFADVISPRPKLAYYSTILEMPMPRLRVYPIVSFISEKLEVLVALGEINSRMKDFYDLYIITTTYSIDGGKLVVAIRKTFERRRTEILDEVPAGLTDEFAANQQTQWDAFLRRIGAAGSGMPALNKICGSLRCFLAPVLEAAGNNSRFEKRWSPHKGWI